MNNEDGIQIKDKYLGSLLGAIVGDALGWPNENRNNRLYYNNADKQRDVLNFVRWQRKAGGQYQAYKETVLPGEYSDDSQLLLATARSLMYGRDWAKYFFHFEIPFWLLYERGGGGATKRAARKITQKKSPWGKSNKVEEIKSYFNAGGNGVAMRILPHVYYCAGNIEEMRKQVFTNGIYTHGHPRALLGALLYAQAVHYLINKKDSLAYGELVVHLLNIVNIWGEMPQPIDSWRNAACSFTNIQYSDLWEKTVEEVKQSLLIVREAIENGAMDLTDETLEKLKCFDKKENGSGVVASVVSIYLVSKFAVDRELPLAECIALKNADTDTLASMVGGLLGAIYGTEWIRDEWKTIQDYQYIVQVAEQLGEKPIEFALESLPSDSAFGKLKEGLLGYSVGEEIRLSADISLWVKEIVHNQTIVKNIEPTTVKFQTSYGQILYMTSVQKIKQELQLAINADEIVERKNGSKDLERVIGTEDLYGIVELFSNQARAKKMVNLIADILNEIGTALFEKENIERMREISKKISSNGIEEAEILRLISYLWEKSWVVKK